jgi:peptidoglycan hydrolase-like protein with peptidoglycan-binding domain
MRHFVSLFCAALMIWPVWAASGKSSKSRTEASAAAKSSTKKKASRRASSRRPAAPTWRNRQLKPTQDRYVEIQQALAAKGYLQSEPDGNWNEASVDALRKFQQDQNLEVSGKIDSLSLIALGLGPKYETAKAPVAPPATEP